MIKLVENKVAVVPIFDPDTSPGGIIIPDIAKERCDQGVVKYIGPDCKWCKPGMYVIYSGYTGSLISIQGEGKLIILPEDFVIAELPEVENVYVPGLYFRGRLNLLAQAEELAKLIAEAYDPNEGFSSHEMAKILVEKGVTSPISSPYFQADYEHIMEYLASAFQDSDWYRSINVKTPKPRYNKDNELEPV